MNFWQTSLFETEITGNDYEAMCDALGGIKNLRPDEFGLALHQWAKNNISKRINTLCLFSGAGGLDIGFHDAGFNVVECVELEKPFTETMIKNKESGQYFEETNIVCKDIRNYDPDLKDIDFIIGGPPCQPFSKAGIRAAGAKGTKDDRGTLFEEYVRILDKLKPKGFLFENVSGILSAEKGKAMAVIVKAFENLGYTLHYRLLDAADYGVPQNRERLILVGVRKGEFDFPAPTHGIDSYNKKAYYSSGEALKNLEQKKEISPGLNGRFGHLLDEIPPGLNYSFYTERMGHPNPVFAWRSKFSDFLYKADPELPVRTLKASGGQYTGPFHWLNRHFSVDELKRLQTFPDNYVILGGRGIGAKQIGNSVPPQFARILALSVLEQIFGIELPFKLNKLKPHHQLSFRKIKSKRTKYYYEKAQEAIKKLDYQERAIKVRSRSYYGLPEINTVLKESRKKVEGFFQIKFNANKKKWQFELRGEKTDTDLIYKIIIRHSEKGNSLFGDVNHIELYSYSSDIISYLTLWKAFERELINNKIKADLVQLNGYYQYKPILDISIEIESDLIPDNLKSTWEVLATMAKDEEHSKIRNINEIAIAYDIEANLLANEFRQFKEIGFEIRNHNTNTEIEKDHYLIPYLFPSLNALSLQRQTSL